MHISIDTKELVQKLELVGRVSTKHVTLPVLQCVLLEVKDNSLTLRATNLEIGIETSIPVKTEEEGSIAVPAHTLIQTINLITQKNTTLRTEDQALVVEGNNSHTHIKSISHDEFPTIPTIKGSSQKLQSKLFSLGIKSVAFSASQSSIKPELCSINIHQKKEHSLTFVATDSFRLMEKTVSQKGVILDSPLLIPIKNAIELSRICDLVEEDVELKVDDNQLSLSFTNGVYVTTRLTTGSFPDYEQIIPKEFVTHATVLKDDLIHAFKKTNIFLNKFFQVGIHITEKNVTISANSSEVGTTAETISASTKGGDITLNFNQRYFSEPLTHINDDSVTLHFAGIGRSVVIDGVNDKSFRYLVMPMNK